MKIARAFSFALVVGSMTLLAQSSGRNGRQAVVATVEPGSINCPVEIRAQWQFGRNWLQKVPSSGNQPPGLGRGIKLTLTNPALTEIVGVRVTVNGHISKSRVSPVLTSQDQSEISKTIDLKLNVGPKSEVSTVLFLAGFTSVTLIDVDSIRYANGSTWTPSPVRTCHVVPDSVMLISRR